MDACFFKIYIHTHTQRAFQLQSLTSAKRFTQSRLDFSARLFTFAVVFLSLPIMYCLALLTSTFIWLVWLHQWKLALHMNWYSHDMIHFYNVMLERSRQSCFLLSLMACSLLNRKKLKLHWLNKCLFWSFWEVFPLLGNAISCVCVLLCSIIL